MLIIVGGEGGGTGTGAMPVIAKAAREEGILTIGVVTKPFAFEGSHRMAAAEQGIRDLQDEVDTLIVSANDNLRSVTNGAVSFKKAFEISDTFLADCVMSFVSIIQETGLVNVDFADLCSVAKDRKSRAIMGTGYAEGENCGTRAIEEAMSSLLLDFGDVKWESVCNVVVCIHGGDDLQMTDVNDINEIVKNKISPNANIIMGATIRHEMKNSVRVFVFGTTNKVAEPAKMEPPRKKQRREEPQQIQLEYSDSDSIYVGTRHSLHEDVDEYQASQPAQQTQKGGFFSRLFGKPPQPEIKRTLPPFLRTEDSEDDD
jgi:cell division protein FtsZ